MKLKSLSFVSTFILLSLSLRAANPDSLVIKYIQEVTNSVGGMGNVIETGDNFGGRITCIGDLDSDGVPDLAVASSFDNSASSSGGVFFILFMNSNGTVKSYNKIYSGHSGMDSLPSGCRFGQAIANLGDIDGDGIQDLAVTAVGANNYAGAVYILNMKRNGDVKKSTLIDGNTSGFTGVISSGDLMGFDVACPGDVNGDGVSDVLIGAGGSDNGAGAAYILFLNKNSTLKGYKRIDDSALGSGVLNSGDNFGEAVGAIGDQDGDGVPDIGVGAEFTNNSTGAFYEIHLNKDGSVKNYVKIDGGQKALSNAIYSGDAFGSAVVLLPDLDGDGNKELLVGAEADSTGGSLTGAAYILYMDSSHNVKSYEKIDNNTPGLKGKLGVGTEFGAGVAYLPSFNNNYKYSVAIGALEPNESGYFYNIFLDPSNTKSINPSTLLGHVTQSTGSALKNSEIYLLTYNWGDSVVTAVDSIVTDSTGYYKFNLTSTDTIVYLYADPDSSTYPGQMPTYDSLSTVFQYAHPIRTKSGTDTVNFSTIAGTNPGGGGFIGGKVTVCYCKKAGPGTPVAGLKIILMEAGKPVAYTYTNKLGTFGFKNLGIGNYSVFVDRPLVDNTKAPVIDITVTKNIQQNLNFSLTPTQLELLTTTAVENVVADKNGISVYPNPFTGVTHLNYHLETDENVDIRLFDVSGKEVSVIASGMQNSGDYSYTIDKNNNITSGVYFVRYIIENEVSTLKIVNVE